MAEQEFEQVRLPKKPKIETYPAHGSGVIAFYDVKQTQAYWNAQKKQIAALNKFIKFLEQALDLSKNARCMSLTCPNCVSRELQSLLPLHSLQASEAVCICSANPWQCPIHGRPIATMNV